MLILLLPKSFLGRYSVMGSWMKAEKSLTIFSIFSGYRFILIDMGEMLRETALIFEWLSLLANREQFSKYYLITTPKGE